VKLGSSTATKVHRPQIRGDVVTGRDLGFDEARQVWNAMIDRRPGAVVRCAGSADVVASVRFAREHDLLVSVRGGGHNVAGKAVADGALMVDLSAMRGVHVDPAISTVRVAGGCLWSDVDRETQAFGLATTGGTVSHTGVGGLTLGGGIGWLSALHGLTCDNVQSIDLVTADGEYLRVSGGGDPRRTRRHRFPHRGVSWDFDAVAQWTEPEHAAGGIAWAHDLWQELAPFSDGVYVNHLDADDRGRVASADGPNYERLVSLKQKYDPDNFFRLNNNIPPT
jgi:FAD/FMN-containing dehydrogenase